jgi:hypothetical protein
MLASCTLQACKLRCVLPSIVVDGSVFSLFFLFAYVLTKQKTLRCGGKKNNTQVLGQHGLRVRQGSGRAVYRVE